jgi:hypothetical protein
MESIGTSIGTQIITFLDQIYNVSAISDRPIVFAARVYATSIEKNALCLQVMKWMSLPKRSFISERDMKSLTRSSNDAGPEWLNSLGRVYENLDPVDQETVWKWLDYFARKLPVSLVAP